jgi:hypothetical protein
MGVVAAMKAVVFKTRLLRDISPELPDVLEGNCRAPIRAR